MCTRLLFCLSFCLLSTPSLAQVEADNTDSPADNFESHVVERGRVFLLGKSKNKILGYAVVTNKAGWPTTDWGGTKDYEENTTRYKLSVVVDAADSSTANVEAKVRQIKRYWESDGGLLGPILGRAGYARLLGRKFISGTIVTSLNAGAEWTLRLEAEIDRENLVRYRQGSITSNDRAVDIVDNQFSVIGTDVFSPGLEYVSGIEFIENGKLLGSIGDGVYLFSKDLDSELKLMLAAAMETVSYLYLGNPP